MKRNMGFSLIEIMVVVVIIALLTSVALPMYNGYVQRSKISEATSTLSSLRVRMEQYYQDNRTYLNAAGNDCGVGMPGAPEAKYFTYSCTDANSPLPSQTTYTITATGSASFGMANFRYTINQLNAKTSTITAAGWQGNATCWALKPDGTC